MIFPCSVPCISLACLFADRWTSSAISWCLSGLSAMPRLHERYTAANTAVDLGSTSTAAQLRELPTINNYTVLQFPPIKPGFLSSFNYSTSPPPISNAPLTPFPATPHFVLRSGFETLFIWREFVVHRLLSFYGRIMN